MIVLEILMDAGKMGRNSEGRRKGKRRRGGMVCAGISLVMRDENGCGERVELDSASSRVVVAKAIGKADPRIVVQKTVALHILV